MVHLGEKEAVRISLAIENMGILVLIGLMFIGVGVADGVKSAIIATVGILIVMILAKSDTSRKEKRAYGLFVESDEDRTTNAPEKA
jgi:hypothetical protein